MASYQLKSAIVRAGDREGLGTVYSPWGSLIPKSDEVVLRTAEDWEMNVRSPWRSVLPGMIFTGFVAPTSSKLFITTHRIVLVRKIDPWRELKGELTPLGVPKAAEREAVLRKLQAMGARQFCEIWPSYLDVARTKRHGKPARSVQLFLNGRDGKQYVVAFWKPRASEPEVVSLIESRFHH